MDEFGIGSAQDNQSEEDKIFMRFVKDVIKESEKMFTSEESNGKYLDLNTHF